LIRYKSSSGTPTWDATVRRLLAASDFADSGPADSGPADSGPATAESMPEAVR